MKILEQAVAEAGGMSAFARRIKTIEGKPVTAARVYGMLHGKKPYYVTDCGKVVLVCYIAQ